MNPTRCFCGRPGYWKRFNDGIFTYQQFRCRWHHVPRTIRYTWRKVFQTTISLMLFLITIAILGGIAGLFIVAAIAVARIFV